MKGAIIYISSNRENPKFEQRIIDDMLSKKGDLQVYSVTQKPMDFENNIVVGDVGVSGFNFCRQLQMVVESADVDYVVSCEADCLYSPDYFTFVPPKLDTVYRNTNIYLVPYQRDLFWKKRSSTFSQVAGRNFLLNRLESLLEGQPQWNIEMKNFPKEIGRRFLERWDTFETEYGCLSLKTGDGMRKHSNSDRVDIRELPYWGKSRDFKKKYYGDK